MATHTRAPGIAKKAANLRNAQARPLPEVNTAVVAAALTPQGAAFFARAAKVGPASPMPMSNVTRDAPPAARPAANTAKQRTSPADVALQSTRRTRRGNHRPTKVTFTSLYQLLAAISLWCSATISAGEQQPQQMQLLLQVHWPLHPPPDGLQSVHTS